LVLGGAVGILPYRNPQAAEGLRRSEEQSRILVQGAEAVENRDQFLIGAITVGADTSKLI